jgi:NADH:ubiquinone oxidoreductase subunit F (NADH-binding)/NADH:ubiquinone oxidoreductase subunit E
MLLQALADIQARHGYLPAAELRRLAAERQVPLYRLEELASYYPWFRRQPPADLEVGVCRDLVCHLRGSPALRQQLEKLGKNIQIVGVSCLGRCDAAPWVVRLGEQVRTAACAEELLALVQAAAAGQALPAPPSQKYPPAGWRLDPYEGQPRYQALRRLLATDNGAAALLRELEIAGLRGLGGAGFPTARKWAAVRAAPAATKYVIANADESEPGAFKDRELLRRAPYLVLEGLVLAGLVTGATRGILYLRHEYHEEADIWRQTVAQAQALGVWGDNLLNSGRSFQVELFLSPGGYIQGEETALLEALEDRRGEPRNKPPYPVTQGLFGQPTLINNVETLAWVPAIWLHGGAWYRDQGVGGAAGRRLVSVSGAVRRPGVYEVPFGIRLGDLIQDYAGGLPTGRSLKAIAPSGPSGGFLPARLPADRLPPRFRQTYLPAGATAFDLLDLPLDWEPLAALDSMLGAALIVYDEGTDLLEQALLATTFFRNESCGKCVPCRLGTQKLVDLLQDWHEGRGTQEQRTLVEELAQLMQQTSICGLGQVAGNPIRSLLRYCPEELSRVAAPTTPEQESRPSQLSG